MIDTMQGQNIFRVMVEMRSLSQLNLLKFYCAKLSHSIKDYIETYTSYNNMVHQPVFAPKLVQVWCFWTV